MRLLFYDEPIRFHSIVGLVPGNIDVAVLCDFVRKDRVEPYANGISKV